MHKRFWMLALMTSIVVLAPSAAEAAKKKRVILEDPETDELSEEEPVAPPHRRPSMTRSGTRPFFASFSLSPAFNVSNSVTQLKIAQGFGYHFSGDTSGFAL